MSRHLITVGAGDYWNGLVGPSIEALKESGLISGVTTVDVQGRQPPKGSFHRKRLRDEPLSELVDSLEHEEPLVILSHPNQLHTPEAIELMDNSGSSPKVLIEKPYAIDREQLQSLQDLAKRKAGDIGFLEYYLTMKGLPLALFGGEVKEDSFYFQDNGTLKLRSPEVSLKNLSGKLEKMIGQPLFVVSDVLEGEGSYGSVEHRNLSLVDTEQGGGMIQDLGHHSITPLMALGRYLGRLDADSIKDVRVATCDEYLEFARRHLPKNRVGESYAELDLETSKGIPVRVSIGKYVENGSNQRQVTVVGTRGSVLYDMTNNVLAVRSGDDVSSVVPLLEADKKGVPKYLAVLRAGIETVEGRNPFNFNPVSVALTAQDIVLDALERAPSRAETYSQGTMHDEIFS